MSSVVTTPVVTPSAPVQETELEYFIKNVATVFHVIGERIPWRFESELNGFHAAMDNLLGHPTKLFAAQAQSATPGASLDVVSALKNDIDDLKTQISQLVALQTAAVTNLPGITEATVNPVTTATNIPGVTESVVTTPESAVVPVPPVEPISTQAVIVPSPVQ